MVRASSTSPSHSHFLSTLPMAQSSSLKHFDPFATHPFMNCNALERHPAPAMPSQYPRHIPSYTTGTPAHMQSPRQPPPASNTIHSPEPRRPITLANPQQPSNATQPGRKPIFIPFQQDRSSPDLDEILLRKKLTQALGHVALGLDVKHDSYPSP